MIISCHSRFSRYFRILTSTLKKSKEQNYNVQNVLTILTFGYLKNSKWDPSSGKNEWIYLLTHQNAYQHFTQWRQVYYAMKNIWILSIRGKSIIFDRFFQLIEDDMPHITNTSVCASPLMQYMTFSFLVLWVHAYTWLCGGLKSIFD